MDDDYTVVNLDFTFVYFGKSYTQVSISPNGFFCFGIITACKNRMRPSFYDILIGLNYDLDTTRNGSGQIYYKSLNDSTLASLYVNLLDPQFVPKNIFMITYDNVLPFERSSNSRVSFQIYLLKNSFKSYVIFKYTSCPTDLNQLTPSGLLNINNKGILEEILLIKNQECSSSNVNIKGTWGINVTRISKFF
jgi:hypothetical protein